MKLLAKARDREVEEKAWQLYLTKYPNMTKENYMPFDEFFNATPADNKPVDEILEDVKETLNTFRGQWVA